MTKGSIAMSGYWMLLLAALLAGCGGSTRYYTFPNVREDGKEPLGRVQGVVVVGPINLNPDIDRPQLVVRRSPTQLEIRERDLWAGSLQQEIQRQTIDGLGRLLHSDKVVPFPWSGSESASYRVSLEVLELSATPGGQARLVLAWSIYHERSRKQLRLETEEYSAPVPADSDLDTIVRLYSGLQQQAVRALARRLGQLVGHG
jgi:uncharacterized protein